MNRTRVALLALLALPALAANGDFEKQSDGIELRTGDGMLRVRIVGENIARVTFAKSAILFTRGTSAVLPNAETPKWSLSETGGELVLATSKLKVRVERQTGRVSFVDAAGQPILAEAAGGHVLESAEVQGEQTYHARQVWQANADESLYASGLRYDRPAESLSTIEIRRLHRSIAEILTEAIKYGGSTLDDEQFVNPDGKPGTFQQYHQVYNREGLPCYQCRTLIQRVVLRQRSTFFCEKCQS